ncbi:MAG: hypothetical protein ABI625_19725 [bacterium]
MMCRVRGLTVCSLLLPALVSATAAAQEAVTIQGHVLAASAAVRGATVRIESMNLGATTDERGLYHFIVSSSRVRGQTVALTASYPRFRPKSVDVALVGGSITQDFDLSSNDPAGTPRTDRPRVTDTSPGAQPTTSATRPAPTAASSSITLDTRPGLRIDAPIVDSTSLSELAGPVDLPTALAGRFAGLDVLSASTVGGTSAMFVRGPHTLFGLTQPLVVVNGIVMDNSNLTNATQIAGRGGFDYGSGVNDLNVDDIATVQLLSGPIAAMRFGGRGANGALVVTTKNANGLNGLTFSASQSFSNSTTLRVPAYQNLYGQGLGGTFSFFDGKGGGVSDTTDQSWGPALDGSPQRQASFTQAGRADVRPWFPQAANVSDYFVSGHTLATNVGLQNGSENGQFRVSLSNRTTTGRTPETSIAHRSAVATGSAQPSARLSVNGDLQLYTDRGEDRSGSGFDESNAVSTFSHTPRQIDFATYMTRLRDATLQQLSWNYSGRNNPYWTALENDNHDSRTRYVVGGAASYALADWVTASVRAGTDHTSDSRSFTVASGWMGGFPYLAGRGDFSTGGFQSDDITSNQTDAEVMLRAAPRSTGSVALAYTVGAGRRSDDITTDVRAADKLADVATPQQVQWNGSSSTNTIFGSAEARVRDFISAGVSARMESSSLQSGSSASTIYPAAIATIDFAHADSTTTHVGPFQTFALRAGFSRSGNVGTSALLQRLGVTSATTAASIDALSDPEVTTSIEAGATLRASENRMGLDISVYRDLSENLLFAFGGGYARTGSLSNKGVEATLTLVPIRVPHGLEWTVAATVGKNSNVVEELSSGGAVALAPSFGGATIEARTGRSLGVIVGQTFLRDAAGQLVLRNGHPLADSTGGSRVLGESAPSWIGGLTTSARIRAFEVSVHFDTHRGGKVFSSSNMAGAYSGVLMETSFRPDTGLLIDGVDVATGSKNAVHVSTEDYYHALGPITERWVYDASFVKLREARVSVAIPLQFIPALRVQSLRMSIIGRNLALWADAPNIDPETVLSTSTFRGAEMGQLPTAKSVGFQLSLTP